ncbi:50S ribosomal protein L6 [bacterium]|nr:50S ribosomal protein L6 [bacterium]|tara:strand:- start:619 stop:1152 length:534 start_codon:yes stop_codon:yes gene_type:complete
MSRLGKQPIALPSGVEATLADKNLTVKGPKGTLSRDFRDDVELKIEDNSVVLTPDPTSDLSKALWGTYASHVNNMVHGVTEGFEKKLEIEGVGYRAEMKGRTLVLNVGFSHPVELELPEGLEVTVEKNVITVTGIDKESLGQFAANIRKVKKPEPYKGKGIHYVGEYIIRKQGKKAV